MKKIIYEFKIFINKTVQAAVKMFKNAINILLDSYFLIY